MTWRTVYIYIYYKYLFFIGKKFAPALSYKVLLFYSPSVKKMLFATVRLTLRPGGHSTNVYKGRLRLKVPPLTLLCTIFHEKRYPFHTPSADKWHSVDRPYLKLCIFFFYAVNAPSYRNQSQNRTFS